MGAKLLLIGTILLAVAIGLKSGSQEESSGIGGAYLLAFHACDTAMTNCRDPRHHQVFLAQSNDGANWSLVLNWTPYPGSVPDVIRRGDILYVYTPGQVRRYRFATQTWEAPVRVGLNDPVAPSFVDPSLFVDDQGRLTLFYLVATPGSDPAQCAPGQTSCAKYFRSATEVPGSDGTAFVAEPGDRVAITLHPNPVDSASDLDIFYDGKRYVLYISRGNSIQVYTSPTLHGSYSLLTALPEGYLTRNTGGIGSGYFDPITQRYWTYVHTPQGIIRRAVHSTLNKQLVEADFTTVLTGSSLGLESSWRVESPGFAVNTAGLAAASSDGTLDKIYFQIALNVNYSSDPTEQQKIIQTIRRHLDLTSKYGIKANYYFTGLAAEMTQQKDPALIELLKEKSQAKLLTLGHHGANRPPHPQNDAAADPEAQHRRDPLRAGARTASPRPAPDPRSSPTRQGCRTADAARAEPQKKPHPSGPPTANTVSRKATPARSTERITSSSASTAHPTATRLPGRESTERTARSTEDASRQTREPQKPTNIGITADRHGFFCDVPKSAPDPHDQGRGSATGGVRELCTSLRADRALLGRSLSAKADPLGVGVSDVGGVRSGVAPGSSGAWTFD